MRNLGIMMAKMLFMNNEVKINYRVSHLWKIYLKMMFKNDINYVYIVNYNLGKKGKNKSVICKIKNNIDVFLF